MLRGAYDFDQQRRTLQDMIANNITLAEVANINLKKIHPAYISQAVQELKE